MPKSGLEFCTVPSCERNHRANGYCMMHLSRVKKGLPLDMPVQRTGPQGKTGCDIPSCPKGHYAKSLCRFHYERSRQGTSVERPLGMQERVYSKVDTLCEGPKCRRKVWSKGVCRAHYMQRWNGYELTEVRKHNFQMVTEEGRVCTMCDIAKDDSEYYTRNTGIKQSRCKKCMTALAAIKQYERKGGLHPDWAVEYVNRYV